MSDDTHLRRLSPWEERALVEVALSPTDKAPVRPCPFCGHNNVKYVYDNEDTDLLAKCANCDAHGPSVHFAWNSAVPEQEQKRQALNAWNSRVEGAIP